MATWYVDTGATGAANGTSYADAYTTLQAAVAAKAANLTGAGPITFLCRASTGAADATQVLVDGYTTTATDYIEIKGDPNEATGRCTGIWDTSRYRLSVADNEALFVLEEYARVDGIQIEMSSQSSNTVLTSWSTETTNDLRLSNCILRGAGTAVVTRLVTTSDPITIWNCLFCNVGTNGGSSALELGENASLYNCTVIGDVPNGNGIKLMAGTCTCKNVYACGYPNYAFFANGQTFALTNCASSDTTAGSSNGCVSNVACSTDNFISVTAGNADYLKPKAGGALEAAGAAPGGSAPLNYTTDIAGTTVSTWDIGAFNYPDAAAAQFARPSSDVAGGTFRSILVTAPFGPRVIA